MQRRWLEATRLIRDETGDPVRTFAGFELYTLRHACLTRWAPHMDPWTLAYLLAGHRDMNITKRYIHPQEQTILTRWRRPERYGVGTKSGHSASSADNGRRGEYAAVN